VRRQPEYVLTAFQAGRTFGGEKTTAKGSTLVVARESTWSHHKCNAGPATTSTGQRNATETQKAGCGRRKRRHAVKNNTGKRSRAGGMQPRIVQHQHPSFDKCNQNLSDGGGKSGSRSGGSVEEDKRFVTVLMTSEVRHSSGALGHSGKSKRGA